MAGRRSDSPPPRPRSRYTTLGLSLGVLAVLGLIYYALATVRPGGGESAGRRPFDPQTTNRDELIRVTEAVSRIISAPPDQHEIAVATLESIRTESPGARDLKEACVNTYRGMIRAEQAQSELRGILGGPDAGEIEPSRVSATDRARAETLFREANDQIELVNQSRNRCMDLYSEAVQRMGLRPARRWQRPQ